MVIKLRAFNLPLMSMVIMMVMMRVRCGNLWILIAVSGRDCRFSWGHLFRVKPILVALRYISLLLLMWLSTWYLRYLAILIAVTRFRENLGTGACGLIILIM